MLDHDAQACHGNGPDDVVDQFAPGHIGSVKNFA